MAITDVSIQIRVNWGVDGGVVSIITPSVDGDSVGGGADPFYLEPITNPTDPFPYGAKVATNGNALGIWIGQSSVTSGQHDGVFILWENFYSSPTVPDINTIGTAFSTDLTQEFYTNGQKVHTPGGVLLDFSSSSVTFSIVSSSHEIWDAGYSTTHPISGYSIYRFTAAATGPTLTDAVLSYYGGFLYATLNPYSASPTLLATPLTGPGSYVLSNGMHGVLGMMTGGTMFIVRRDPDNWTTYQAIFLSVSFSGISVISIEGGLASIPDSRTYGGATFQPLSTPLLAPVSTPGYEAGYITMVTLPPVTKPSIGTRCVINWNCVSKCSEYTA